MVYNWNSSLNIYIDVILDTLYLTKIYMDFKKCPLLLQWKPDTNTESQGKKNNSFSVNYNQAT